MPIRSWLLVPADNPAKLEKAPRLGADAVVLELAEAIAASARDAARSAAREWLAAHRQALAGPGFQRWLRIAGMDTAHWREDLAAIMPGGPDGIVLPRAADPEQVRTLAAEIYELEQRAGLAHNSVGILPLVGETARSALAIGAYIDNPHPRIAGLAWNADALAHGLGAQSAGAEPQGWSDAARQVRANTLLAAQATGLFALDTAFTDLRDGAGMRQAARRARTDGFEGMFALHPQQVAEIHTAFAPTADELAHARSIIALFAADPGARSVCHEGRMHDRSWLERAKRIVDRE